MLDSQPVGPVMLDLQGTTLAPEERELLNHPAVGGVILFSRNYESPRQAAALVADVRAARRGELLLAVDQEGGRVQRMRARYTRLPAAARYLEHCGGDVAAAEPLAREAGWLMAAEVRAVDIDFSFAPVLDVDCGVSEIIGDRAFARDAETATHLAAAFMAGMAEAGMPAVGKHFPGHGGVAADSHLALPVDDRPWDVLWSRDLLPYRRLIPRGLDAIMPAHVVYPSLDQHPAGFSRFWLQHVLRQRLDFKGVIFSDDLSMEGAAAIGDFAQRARSALDAGCDMVLVCNNPEAAAKVVESLDGLELPESARRLAALRRPGALPWAELEQTARWRRAVELVQPLITGDGA
ncbi:beta-N-acetylhexosaminidase [Methylogaea oryzae]|uniref:Beta-hexosaminidase n=2 Tax=Methylogaea oryzae TaxID=1295382 RepID=A0A8D4VRH7_9GAMM|nr:beta-N-acetylhexosaminidase [Methylogaea oryzae]BBL71239.1 beta-hexosaminidase [Methylogaea oryzae]